MPSSLPPAGGRAEGKLSRQFEGTGLGPPSSNSYVEMHDGSFDLQSSVGAGTTVTLRFPAERIISEGAAAASSLPVAIGRAGHS
jgi:signal transduction histidine kinase